MIAVKILLTSPDSPSQNSFIHLCSSSAVKCEPFSRFSSLVIRLQMSLRFDWADEMLGDVALDAFLLRSSFAQQFDHLNQFLAEIQMVDGVLPERLLCYLVVVLWRQLVTLTKSLRSRS